ncbi:hypothetical protein AMR72_17195 [Flavobacterium psychrophilum]|nr:hypothetical protein AMR72_17195 [Flavobacterium psychrophilum]AOE54088.1 hypothetical protein ALW18_17185 [Flavobacterium psychrophilum]
MTGTIFKLSNLVLLQQLRSGMPTTDKFQNQTKMSNYYKYLTCAIIILLASSNADAQHPSGFNQAKKIYEGLWINKQTTRNLQIVFDNAQYATITDWTAKYQKRESGDVYKAFIKDGKLVMPEDKQHHAPYSEIIANKNTIIYKSKPLMGRKSWDILIFTKGK